MKAAVAALACLLRLAPSALAAEPVRDSAAAVAPAAAQSVAPRQATSAAVAVQATTQAKAEPQAAQPRADTTRHDSSRLRICFSPAETRDTVVAHRLAEPFRALRVGRQQGEALRAKLCKWKQDQFVYEIFVLRRDGRIVRVYMNAQNGQMVGALEDH